MTQTEMSVGCYRCAECGHGKHLHAWAGCNAYGPVDPGKPELLRHDDVEEWGLHEDSIECAKHPGAEIQRFIDGAWRRWFCCKRCDGTGNRSHRGSGYWRCDGCEPGKSRGWLTPIAEAVAR